MNTAYTRKIESMWTHCDVIVVGLGPVGGAMANLLGNHGVRVLVVEKSENIFQAPRAIALDNEALRVLQMCGLDEDAFEKVAIPEVRMHSPLLGQFSRASTQGTIDGHPKLVTFFQPQLEQALRDRLKDLPDVQVVLSCQLMDFHEVSTGVQCVLQTGDGLQTTVHAKYLVGADGATSMVRHKLGQDFRGKTYAEDWLVVDALNAPKPIDHVEFICNPGRPVPHMVAPGGRQRWEFKLNSSETRAQMESPSAVRELLSPWADSEQLEIERVAVYRFHARVAQQFSVGRAHLIGDAAHITPPFVGQGLVAGLRDAANLAWKLAWVIKGLASPALIDSYAMERRPHVLAMIRLAQMMGRLVMPSNQVTALLLHGAMKCINMVPSLRRKFENLEVKPANAFVRGGFFGPAVPGQVVPGAQFPQVWLRQRSPEAAVQLSDDVLSQNFAVVGFDVDPADSLTPVLKQQWEAMGGRFVSVHSRGPGKTGHWEDFTGGLIKAADQRGRVTLVRPDKVVLAQGHAHELSALVERALLLVAHGHDRGG